MILVQIIMGRKRPTLILSIYDSTLFTLKCVSLLPTGILLLLLKDDRKWAKLKLASEYFFQHVHPQSGNLDLKKKKPPRPLQFHSQETYLWFQVEADASLIQVALPQAAPFPTVPLVFAGVSGMALSNSLLLLALDKLRHGLGEVWVELEEGGTGHGIMDDALMPHEGCEHCPQALCHWGRQRLDKEAKLKRQRANGEAGLGIKELKRQRENGEAGLGIKELKRQRENGEAGLGTKELKRQRANGEAGPGTKELKRQRENGKTGPGIKELKRQRENGKAGQKTQKKRAARQGIKELTRQRTKGVAWPGINELIR